MFKSAPSQVLSRSILSPFLIAATLASTLAMPGYQAQDAKKPEPAAAGKKEEPKGQAPKEADKNKKKATGSSTVVQLSQVETMAELAIIAYGGRKQIETVRSAVQEEGTIRLASDQGDRTGDFNLRSIRKEKSWQDLVRVDIDLKPADSAPSQPQIKFVIAFNGASVWSAQNGQYINPRPDAEAAFRAQLTHEYMALLRYKEDGSKLELVGPETVVGVDTNVIDLTNANGEKTRFWLSTKTYRIAHAEYELKLAEGKPPTKYYISYYYSPLRVVQNTLVPARRVMTQDGKFVQELILGRFNYSAKLDPEIFQHLQEQ